MKENCCEVAVIGGGISGLGVARAAAQAGFQTALFEKGRCCGATSRGSLRIMHGGFRYFQTLDLRRVIVSLSDQHHLLTKYPRLIRTLPCLMPLSAWGLKSRWPVRAAAQAYSVFRRAAVGAAAEAGVWSREEVERRVPLLAGLVPCGALFWNDALLLDPDNLRDVLLEEIRNLGADVRENAAVDEIERREKRWVLRVAGQEICSKVVINCSGPWIGAIKRPAEYRSFAPGWCKGFNIVLNRRIDALYAVGLHSNEGRLYFVVPRGETSAVGTWYGVYQGRPEEMVISEEEVNEFLTGFNRAWPGVELKLSDVEHVEAGVLPMKRPGRNGPVLYGSHKVASQGSYIEVLSTKYTTFRSQAEEVVDLARQHLLLSSSGKESSC